MTCDLYIQMKDLGQAQVCLSQTIASLNQFDSNFEGIKLKAYIRLAQLKLLLGDAPDAMTQLVQTLLPRVEEMDDNSLLSKTLLLLAKVCIKMA